MKKKYIIYFIIITALFISISAIPVIGSGSIVIDCWPNSCIMDLTSGLGLEFYTSYVPQNICPDVDEVAVMRWIDYYFDGVYFTSCYDDNCWVFISEGDLDFISGELIGNHTIRAEMGISCEDYYGYGNEISYYELSADREIEIIESTPPPPLPPLPTGGREHLDIRCDPNNCFMPLTGDTLRIFTTNYPSCEPGYTSDISNITLTLSDNPLQSCSDQNCSYTFSDGYFSEEGLYTVYGTGKIVCFNGFHTYSINLFGSKQIFVSGESYHDSDADLRPSAGFMCSLNAYDGSWEVCEDLKQPNGDPITEGTMIYFRDDESLLEYSVPGMYEDILGRIWRKNDNIVDSGCYNCGGPHNDSDPEKHFTFQTKAFYPVTEITLELILDPLAYPTGVGIKKHYIFSGEDNEGMLYIQWNEVNPANW